VSQYVAASSCASINMNLKQGELRPFEAQ
jgi:hypothetical protein